MCPMTLSRRDIIFALIILFAVSFGTSGADTVSEFNVSRDGSFSARNLVLMQKSGTNLFMRAIWGQTFVRVTVLVDGATSLTKKYGEKITASDIQVGDFLNVDGTLSTSADSLIVKAK